MALYEFRCIKGHKVERLCEMESRDDVVECPKCGRRMTRLMPRGTSHKWVGRMLEWGKPDVTVAREEDLIEHESDRLKDMERYQ